MEADENNLEAVEAVDFSEEVDGEAAEDNIYPLSMSSDICQIDGRHKGHQFSLCFKDIDRKVERPAKIPKCQFVAIDGTKKYRSGNCM